MKLPFLKSGNYIDMGVFSVVVIILARVVYQWAPIPFEFGRFLFYGPGFLDPFLTASPILIIGVLLNFYKLSTTRNPPEVHNQVTDIPLTGFSTSLLAGIAEEIVFRWCMFYFLLGVLWWIDSIALQGILKQFFTTQLSHFNYYLTLGPWGNPEVSLDPNNWAIGLAFLGSNWKFQEGHSYQGLSGQIFSWLGGWFFFVIMLKHGLLAAMFVHFSFDLLTFIMLLVDIYLEDPTGTVQKFQRVYRWY